MTTAQYRTLFDAALERGRKHGFSVPSVGPTVENLAFDDPDDATMIRVVNRLLERYDGNSLVGACIHASYFMQPAIEDIVGMPTYFTLGAVEAFGKELYRFDDHQLQQWLRHGLPQPARNIHAWLTLPTMEIVDLTYLVTLKAVVPHLPIEHGIPVMGRVERVQGVTWRPILVGDDVVQRLRAVALS